MSFFCQKKKKYLLGIDRGCVEATRKTVDNRHFRPQ